MSAYLYTWNPAKWHWADLQEAILRINSGEDYDTSWSCGNTKKARQGDIFFLLKVGAGERGVIGCGYISSAPYEKPHWDEAKRAAGGVALRTDLLLKALSDKPIITSQELKRRFPSQLWSPQSSGVSVADPVAKELFEEIRGSYGFKAATPAEIKTYADGKPKLVTYKTYDRNPDARQACIEHYGYDCAVCGFNFGKVYGELGREFVEVHHLRQVADVGEEHLVNPVEDLRPVCANCHRMLHKSRPPLGVDALRFKLKK